MPGKTRPGPRLGRPTRLAAAAIAIVLVTLVSAAPGLAPAARAAADDGIDIRTVSTYTLVPDRGVVRVVIDLTARNTTPDVTTPTGTTRFYFAQVHVAVQPEAVAIRASSGGAGLATTIARRSGFQEVEVALRSRLYLGRTAIVRVAYDLPGGSPRSASGIRVGRAFATFVAWGNGDRAAVRVVMPATFSPSVTGGPLANRTTAGKTVLSADGISDTSGWYARIDADRRSALVSRELTVAPGQRISIRAWPEDPIWLGRVSDRLARGLPVLDELIGLDLAGRRHARGGRGPHPAARGLRRDLPQRLAWDRDQRGPRRPDGPPRGVPRLVQRRPVQRSLDRRGPGRHLRDQGPRPDRDLLGVALPVRSQRPRAGSPSTTGHPSGGSPTRPPGDARITATRCRSPWSSGS